MATTAKKASECCGEAEEGSNSHLYEYVGISKGGGGGKALNFLISSCKDTTYS